MKGRYASHGLTLESWKEGLDLSYRPWFWLVLLCSVCCPSTVVGRRLRGGQRRVRLWRSGGLEGREKTRGERTVEHEGQREERVMRSDVLVETQWQAWLA